MISHYVYIFETHLLRPVITIFNLKECATNPHVNSLSGKLYVNGLGENGTLGVIVRGHSFVHYKWQHVKHLKN